MVLIDLPVGVSLDQIEHTEAQIAGIDFLNDIPQVFPMAAGIDGFVECIVQRGELFRIDRVAFQQIFLIFQTFAQLKQQRFGLLFRDLAHQSAFHTPAQINNIPDIIIIQLGDKRAPLRIDHHQAFGFQLLQHGPDRRTRYPELLRQTVFAQLFPRLIAKCDNIMPHVFINAILNKFSALFRAFHFNSPPRLSDKFIINLSS